MPDPSDNDHFDTVEAQKEIDRQIDVLLKSDIIEESDSPWGPPVVLVRKKQHP